MNDEQIIKALECCFVKKNCAGCPQVLKSDCLGSACGKALDLINRQRAEIEDLKDSNEHLAVFLEEARAEVERLHSEVKEKTETIVFLKDQAVGWSIDFCNLKAKLDTAKSEAIKEFAERLKKETLFDSGWGVIQPDVIDNLVKEMTEVWV